MQPLKALVIFLGVLIFVAFGFLAYGIISKLKTDGNVPPHLDKFIETTVAAPKGARIIETRIEGNRILVRLEKTDGREALVLIDARTGKKLGLIHLGEGVVQ
tara:strand:+ start:20317 stop:20622 length:306 start_codon:yes stop_codon:yes gene_type:complete